MYSRQLSFEGHLILGIVALALFGLGWLIREGWLWLMSWFS